MWIIGTNQKGFANIALIVLVIILAGTLGYITLVRKSAPVEQPRSNNTQDTHSSTPPQTNNTASQNTPSANGKVLSGLEPISLPSYCSFSPDTSTNQQYRWIIDCGKRTKADARGFMGIVLESQGWKFCASGLATASWWKNGVTTGVAEGPNSAYSNPPANSYPFYLFQGKGSECETPPPYRQ